VPKMQKITGGRLPSAFRKNIDTEVDLRAL
jgi:hypothetical protein